MGEEAMLEDQQLLRQYAVDGSEAAFGELVARHVNLVYSAALRRAGGDIHLAQDVAQLVFADLARKARSLPKGVVLAGWLHRATSYACAQMLRTERRRQAREQEAVAMNALESEPAPDWEQIRPLLDDILDRLDHADRDALLLRFFEQRSLAEVGHALGSNEDAARKRVTRALEKLRNHLVRRGVTTPAAALSTLISVHAVQTAPAGLAAVLTTASLAGAVAGTGITPAVLKFMAMTKLKAAIIGTAITAGLATSLVVQHQSLVKMRAERAALQQRAEEQTAATETLRKENDQLARIRVDADELARLRTQEKELLRLRGEVGQLRGQVRTINRPTNSASSIARAGDQPDTIQLPPERVLHVTSMNPPTPINAKFDVRQLTEAGTASIESAAQTALWAVLNGNEAGFGRIRYSNPKAPQISAEAQARMLNDLARNFDGAQEVTVQSTQADGDNRQLVFFRARWPNDDQILDKAAGGTLVFQRTDAGWQLDQFVTQGRPRP